MNRNDVLPDVMEDLEAIARHAASGKPAPPEIARRIRERSERLTEETRRKFGLVDISVPSIRQARGELSESL